MINIYCWRCGTIVNKNNILGLGQFDQSIGRYRGKGFVALNCPRCKKTRYQILDSKHLLTYNKIKNTTNDTKKDIIDINQVIDFYKILDEIDTVKGFLNRSSISTDIYSDMDKPILQPLDVYKLFNKLNSSNLRRLMILTLNKDNYIISWEFLGGELNTPISYEPKIIFQTAFMLEEKTSVIIAQNLSKDFSEPNKKDLLLIKRLIKAGKILGIDFLDHIIIEDNDYYSFDQLKYI